MVIEPSSAGFEAVLQAFGLHALAEPSPVEGGTLNWNYRLSTTAGDCFLRSHRRDVTAARVREEHAAIQFAARKDIPVALPLRTRNGDSVIEIDGDLWAAFPWVEGTRLDRDSIDAVQARAVGQIHGRVQAALADHPLATGAGFPIRWDKSAAVKGLTSAISAAKLAGAEPWIVETMALQLGLLREERLIAPKDVAPHLPLQACHGDFHDQQLLFDAAGEVTLVCDWEMFGVRPRAWEVVRAIAFARLLDTPLQRHYLAGYREHIQVSAEEAHAAIRVWLQSRIVTSWVWTAHFLEGNERVAEFFPRAAHDLQCLIQPGWREAAIEQFVTEAVGYGL